MSLADASPCDCPILPMSHREVMSVIGTPEDDRVRRALRRIKDRPMAVCTSCGETWPADKLQHK